MTQVVGVLTKFGIDIFTNTIKVAVKYSLFLLLSIFFSIAINSDKPEKCKAGCCLVSQRSLLFLLFVYSFVYFCLFVCLFVFFFCFNQIASGSANESSSRTCKFQAQNMERIHWENMGRTCCVQKLFFVFVLTFNTIYVHNLHILNLQFSCTEHVIQ